MSNIDWQYWRLMPLVKDWQAAALSLEIDPESMKYRPQALIAGTGKPMFEKSSFKNLDEEQQFNKRYRLVVTYVQNYGDKVRHYNSNDVNLAGFAKWALAEELKIPPELAAIAKHLASKIDEVSEPANTETREEPPQPRSHEETTNWILRVQTEASRKWTALRKSGASPTKFAIKSDLAKWCRDQDVKTTTGINPSADYIYRHALRRWEPPTD